jgi:hypothetical protein
VVQLQGIEEMLTAVKAAKKQPYPPHFELKLEQAVAALRAFRDVRYQFNEGPRVDDARQRFVQHLNETLSALPR